MYAVVRRDRAGRLCRTATLFQIALAAMSLVGKPAVEFALADTNGAIRQLSDFAGKWLLLVFHRHLA
jgi:hypothetical protein